MTRVAILFATMTALLSAVGLAGARENGPADDDLPCRHLVSATFTGIIRELGMIQDEPAASPQFYFRLDLRTPWCGLRSLDFSQRHPLPCLDGDVAAVTGELWPPSPPLDVPQFEVRHPVTCTRVPADG